MQLRPVHLCIIQPLGYVHALGFLDQARYLRHQFRRFGVDVSLAKNRLRHDAVNIVFGAHLGFDPALRRRHACVFFNLEQMGPGGAAVPQAYRDLLATSAVLDYDPANPPHYTAYPEDVPILGFGHAPYLAPSALPFNERPIDLLFLGSMNERRRSIIDQVEAAGASVAVLDGALYGPERDELVRQAKAILNCHFYETARFEQARAFQCLSLGAAFISERAHNTQPPAQFEDAVFWVKDGDWAAMVQRVLRAHDFEAQAHDKLANFAAQDLTDSYADAMVFVQSFTQTHLATLPAQPWQPTRLHIGSGKDYRPGWLNVDILERAEPDVVLDLAKEHDWPLQLHSAVVGDVLLSPGSLDTIFANNVLEHVPDLPTLMGNCLTLLKEGGTMDIEVPYEHARTAWQDPTHIRAMNEASWVYYADWFWYLGWFEYRFHLTQFSYLDANLQPCDKPSAHFMRVTLTKQPTTLAERMTARTYQSQFGGVSEDLELYAAA